MSIVVKELTSIKPVHFVAIRNLSDMRERYMLQLSRLLAAAIKYQPKPIKIHTELEPE